MLTIMIADDEAIERTYLADVFTRQPGEYRVVALAENGGQAVALAAQHRPDIIIMDISMPVLSGLEAARQIRAGAPEQIIVINTAYAEFEMAHQAVADQLDAYLLKPSQADAIFATIQTCLLRKRPKHRFEEGLSSPGAVAYPYAMVDELLAALAGPDLKRLRAATDNYAEFMARQTDPESYRLFVINTLFSVEQALRRGPATENLLSLLDCGRAVRQIGQAGTWAEIRAACGAFFQRLVLLLEEQAQAPAGGAGAGARYIDGHYMDDLTLENLSAIAHFSPAYLSRVFHAEMGVTLKAYLTGRRMEQAAHLLRHSQRMLRDIAGDCGFKNLSHFHRVFKEHTGKTPAQVRKEG